MNRLIILISICFIFAGCAVQVHTVYNHKIDFTNYKKFYWLKGAEFTIKEPKYLNDSLVKQLMQSAIESEMKQKGIEFNADAPDLLMDVQVVVKSDTAYIYHRLAPEYNPIAFKSRDEIIMLKGTLVIDIIDKQASEMVWRSVSVSYFELHPDLTEANFKRGVASALKNYPPALKRRKVN